MNSECSNEVSVFHEIISDVQKSYDELNRIELDVCNIQIDLEEWIREFSRGDMHTDRFDEIMMHVKSTGENLVIIREVMKKIPLCEMTTNLIIGVLYELDYASKKIDELMRFVDEDGLFYVANCHDELNDELEWMV